jgi:predicted alpha/beta superfamily hydrolase
MLAARTHAARGSLYTVILRVPPQFALEFRACPLQVTAPVPNPVDSAFTKFLLSLSLIAGSFSATIAEAIEPMPAHLTLRIPSKVLAETRVINVYVPPGYSGKADIRYPVLYMLDGGVDEDFAHLSTTVDELIQRGDIPPMLLVGIENTERRRDLTGPTTVDTDRDIAPVVGESAAFREFIGTELMPQIRLFYRVNDDTAIIGESLAGLFVVETMFLKPDLFDTYIALDPSLWWNAEQWWREAGSRLDGSVAIHARLFLASAGDSGGATAHLADALCRNPLDGLTWTYSAHPELRHANIFHSLEREVIAQVFSAQPWPQPACEGQE